MAVMIAANITLMTVKSRPLSWSAMVVAEPKPARSRAAPNARPMGSVGRDAENALAERLCRGGRARVEMASRLGLAGRSRGIEPEGHFIFVSRGGDAVRVRSGLDGCKVAGAKDDQGPGCFEAVQHRASPVHQIRGDDDGRGAAVLDLVPPLFRGEQRVERHRDHARLDRGPEGHRKINRIQQNQDDPLLAVEAQIPQAVREAIGALLELCIGQLPVRVDVGDLAAAPGLGVAIDQVGGGVVHGLQGCTLGEDSVNGRHRFDKSRFRFDVVRP